MASQISSAYDSLTQAADIAKEAFDEMAEAARIAREEAGAEINVPEVNIPSRQYENPSENLYYVYDGYGNLKATTTSYEEAKEIRRAANAARQFSGYTTRN